MMPVASELPLTHVHKCEMRPLLVVFSAPLPGDFCYAGLMIIPRYVLGKRRIRTYACLFGKCQNTFLSLENTTV